jgi:hypothetical protein
MLEASPLPIDHFPAVLARLPSDIDVEALGREVKAFQRPRGVRCATDLLRLKSLLHIDKLRTKTEAGTRCWLYAHLIVTLLGDDLSRDFLDSFPSGAF